MGGITVSNSQQVIDFAPYPAAQEYKVLKSDGLGLPFHDIGGGISGYKWVSPTNHGSIGFFQLQVNPVSADDLLAATVLNRLAYGPTPDEIDRIKAMGPQAYIEEQMVPESISESLDIDQVTIPTGWQHIIAPGRASSSILYVYLDVPGEGYIDDIKLVAGPTAEQGINLIRNGDFELPLSTNDWVFGKDGNLKSSLISTEFSHSGNSSLKLIATGPGTTKDSSIYQEIAPALTNNSQYTLSYWFLPSSDTNKFSTVTVRLSNSGIDSSAPVLTIAASLTHQLASLSTFQQWYLTHAIQSRRQLLEVLSQFFYNHFTTYHSKTRDYMDGQGTGGDFAASEFEFRALSKWRDVLMNPDGTFYDLLKISAESPAMIIYLDTISSTKGAANENYARELMELFTMGVDNGYDQSDIEQMARAWTGWRVAKLPPGQENNPLAAAVANKNTDPGVWTFRFSASNHDTNSKVIFPGKTIDARFGAPYAGKSYELDLPARSGSNGLKDGYDILDHLADLPYTQEFISVKLCRTFVHENFMHGVYDYTSANLTPEAQLVKDCMAAWDKPAKDGRKGNIRSVLHVIFNSDLFQRNSGSRQKVKTPFEFVVSFVRALRAAKTDGTFTADIKTKSQVDVVTGALGKLSMPIFNREEPDGWPERGVDWINSASLIQRMRFVQTEMKSSQGVADPIALLQMKLPASQWNDAGAVVDYFLSILFLGEGKANLDMDRSAAIAFLNSNDAGVPNSSLFSSLKTTSTAYNTRVRGMVAFLMGLPRFQEQ